jgi:TRAP-type C4-dicarboxylate transport system permease small subunit
VTARTSVNAGAPAPLRAVLDGIDVLGRLDGWMGALCLLSLACLMMAEVALRSLSNVFPALPSDIPVAWEYGSYLMAAAFTFGVAMTLRAGGHIRVTLVLARLSPAVRRWFETALAAVGTVFTGFLAYSLINFTWRSFVSEQTSISSGSPLWVPQALITFGICLVVLQFVARFLQAAFGLPVENPSMRAASVAE